MNLADLEKLPPEQLQQVLDFAEFLRSQSLKRTFPPGSRAYDFIKDIVVCMDNGPNELTSNTEYQQWVEQFAGCVEGPSDLSTNPKYMEGFGQ